MSSLLSPLTEPGGALALGLRGIRLRLGGGSNGDDVERFRRLYGSLLRDVAPPPPGGDGEVQGYGGGPDVPPNGPMDDMHRPQERGGEPSRQRRGPLPSGDETASAPAAAAAASTPSMLPLRQREERGRTVQSDSKEKARAAAAARQSARYMWSLTEASAWRILSATPSPDKEGNSADTALAVRDEGAVATMAAVRAAEDRAVTAIEDLGEAIAGTGTGEGEVWDYFCDKNILATPASGIRRNKRSSGKRISSSIEGWSGHPGSRRRCSERCPCSYQASRMKRRYTFSSPTTMSTISPDPSFPWGNGPAAPWR